MTSNLLLQRSRWWTWHGLILALESLLLFLDNTAVLSLLVVLPAVRVRWASYACFLVPNQNACSGLEIATRSSGLGLLPVLYYRAFTGLVLALAQDACPVSTPHGGSPQLLVRAPSGNLSRIFCYGVCLFGMLFFFLLLLLAFLAYSCSSSSILTTM